MTHILNVEDDPINAYLTERMLRHHFQVHTAQNADQMWDLLAYQDIRLVMMDIHLGEGKVDGLELLEELRLAEALRDLPVIAVTAYAMPGDRERFLQAGFDGYLPKPFQQIELIESINALLQLS